MKAIVPTRRLQNRICNFLIVVLLLISVAPKAQVSQTFNASGTFTVPNIAGLTSVTVQAWGAGGGGGAAGGRNRGGGGGGAYASGVVTVVPGASYTIVAGIGGTPGVNGGNSSFNTSSIVAAGGTSANLTAGGAGGTVAASNGTIKFAGGNGGTATGNPNDAGAGGGGSAFINLTGSNGSNNNNNVAGTGGTGTGNGGNGGLNNLSGISGTAPGGGGGGKGDGGATSGSGASGRVNVTYTCPVYSISSVNATAGCISTASTITLTGSASSLPVGTYTIIYNLTGANSATGLTASMTVTSAGTGTYNTPVLNNAGLTSVTITNISSGACGNTISTNNLTDITTEITPQISPDPVSANASDVVICKGSSTILELSGGGGVAGEVIKWYTSSCGGTLIGSGNNLSVSPTATTTYYGRYETGTYCKRFSACASVTVTVNQPSQNPVSINASSATICNGQSTTLTLVGGGGGTGEIVSWYTTSCGGTLIGTGTSISVSPSSATTYYARYEPSSPCAITSCVSITINVNNISQNPVSASASETMICSGTPVTLTLNGGGGGTGEILKWYSSSCGGTLVGTGNNLVVTPSVTTTYYGRYETPAPCSFNSTCASVTITINQLSNNPTSATASSTLICNGQSTTLNLIGGGGGSGETIVWYANTCGGTSVGTGNNLSVSPATTTTYYGRYETGNPCNANSTCASITVTVNQIASNPVSATATALTICNGQSTVLSLNGGGGGTGQVIRWYTSSCGSTLAGTGNNLSVSPTSTTTYYGRYETPSPCSANSVCASVTITVNTVSAAPVSASASQALICNGQSTNLILNGGGGGTGELIKWYTASCGGTLVGTGNNLSVSPTSTTTYYGRYETPAPCSSNSACVSVTVTVNQAAADPVSATASVITICSGGSSVLSLNGGGGGTGQVIRWYTSSCGGTLAGTGNNLTVTPTATTIYYGRYETSSPCAVNSQCASVTINVNTKPGNPTSATASVTTICNGQSTNLILNGGGGGTGETIRWYTSSCGGTLIGTGNNLLVAPAITTTYYGRYETASPCLTNSTCASVTITVNQPASVPTSATATQTTICAGSSTTLSIVGGGGGTNPVIAWYSGSCGGSFVGNGNNLSVSPASTTTYYGRYENASPCSPTGCVSVTITVNQPSVAPVSASASQTLICNGQSTTLSLNGGGGGTGEIIRWYNTSCGSGLVGAGNNLVVSPTVTTTYYGRYENAAPCANSTCASVTVTVNQVPSNPTSATASSTLICNGQSSILTLTGGGGGTGQVIKWYSGSCGGTFAGTGNNLSVSPATTTTYYGRYETSAPCSFNSACASVTVTVNQFPANPTSATASATTICVGQSTTLSLNGGGGGTGQTIRWYSTSCGTGLVGTGNSLVVSPAVTTTYYGRYETSAPCSVNSTCASVTITVNSKSVNPVSATASPVNICNGNSSVLSISGGTLIPGSTIRWYSSSCGGTLVGSGNNLSVSPSATTTYYGRYEDPAPCNNNTICVQVTVNVFETITVNAGADLSVCSDATQATPSGATSFNITGGASASGYTSVAWSSNGTGTFTNSNSLSLATYTPSAADKAAGSVVLTLTATSPCGSFASTKTLTIGAPITNNTITLSSVCSAGNQAFVVISQGSLPITGGNGTFTYQWQFSNPGNSNFLNIPGETNATLSVPQGSNNGFYRRIVTSGGCTSISNSIHVNANNVIIANSFAITGGGSYCSGGAGVPIGLSNSIDGLPEFYVTYRLLRNGIYTGVSVQGTGAPFNFPNQTIAGTYTVEAVVSVVNGSTCAAQSVTGSVNVSIDAPVPTVSTGSNQNLCNLTTASLNGSNPSPYTGVWSLISGTGNLSSPASSSTTVNGLTVGNNVFQWTVANGTCRDSARVTIKVDPQPAFTTQPLSATFCIGENLTLNAAVNSSSQTYQWKVSVDGGNTFNDVVNGTNYSGAATNALSILSPTVAMSGYIYRLQVNVTGGCNTSLTSLAVPVYLKNLWLGNTSNSWNDASNWSGNTLPSVSCANVHIPGGRPNQPTLSSGTATITNLIIYPGATLTLNGAALQIGGTINNAGSFNASNGSVEFNGNQVQNIPANTFENNALKDLTISNTAGVLTLNGALDVYGKIDFSGTGKSLISNDYLTLKSTLNGTASVSEIAVDASGNALNTITGKVTVERYISALKAWRFLSIPTNTTQTVKESWQENQPANSTGLSGYGIQITSERPTWAADGFDLGTPAGGTMKIYVPATDTWKGITSTFNPIKTNEGYMTLVRGDRTVNAFGQAPTPTILRSKGTLYTGKLPQLNVAADVFTSIGNPYASAVDFSKVAKSGGVQDLYYIWDPRLGGALGGWQTFIGLGNSYMVVPGGGSYSNANVGIESGNAFLIRAVGTPGGIVFNEDAKINSNNLVHRSAETSAYLKTNLSAVSTSGATLVDGVVELFADNFSNAVNADDALKVTRTGESISIKTSGNYLAAEKRILPANNDSIQLALGQLRQQSYQFTFDANNISSNGRLAYLKDHFLNTETPISLSGLTNISFAVNANPASATTDRFVIVFKLQGALPVMITSVSASKKEDKTISVQWKVESESAIRKYVVQKSEDGRSFTDMKETSAVAQGGRHTYTATDVHPFDGDNFYRVSAIGMDGQKQLSSVARVAATNEVAPINVYPNPVTDKTMNVSFRKSIAGNYSLTLSAQDGQVVLQKNITITTEGENVRIPLGQSVAPGVYNLTIVAVDGGKKNVLSVFIK